MDFKNDQKRILSFSSVNYYLYINFIIHHISFINPLIVKFTEVNFMILCVRFLDFYI